MRQRRPAVIHDVVFRTSFTSFTTSHMIRNVLLFAVVAALPLAPALAQKTEPGTYKDWNKVDEVEIVQSFKFADFAKVVVLPLDKSVIKLPAETDNTYAPTRAMLEGSDAHFIDGLRKSIYEFRKEFTVEPGAEGATGTTDAKILLVRGKLLTLDPGSKAARAFAGFGAGAAKAKISIELVDAATGTVLARMTHERRSGTGNFGGAYEKVMSQSLNEVGQTFGKGLKGF